MTPISRSKPTDAVRKEAGGLTLGGTAKGKNVRVKATRKVLEGERRSLSSGSDAKVVRYK